MRYPTPEGLDAIILDYSVHIQLDDSGRMHKFTRTVERVIRLQGIVGSRQAFAVWIPWRENRPKIKARVITPDGAAHLLDEARISEATPDASAGGSTSIKALSANLPAVGIDSIVEVEIEESDGEAVDPDGRWGEISLNSRYLIGHFSAVIEASSTHALRVEPRGFTDVKKSASQMGRAQQVTIEASGILPGQSGILLPADQTPLPTIFFSTVGAWQNVAQWYSNLLPQASLSAAIPTPKLSEQPAAIQAIVNDIEKKIKSTGVALGSNPYSPQTPAETVRKGSGDPKDIAVLLISKLAEMGIPAKAALVRSAPAPELPAGLPGLEGFTRMVVYVTGEHPLWIDPGVEFASVSRLPLMDQDRFALILDPATTDLVRTPASTASENRETSTTDIQLQDGSEAQVRVTLETRGAFEDLARSVYTPGATEDELEKRRNQLAQMSRTKRVTKLEAGEPQSLSDSYQLHFVAEGYGPSLISDAEALVDLPGPASLSFRQLSPLLEATAEGYRPEQIVGARKTDYYAPPAFTEDTSYRVAPPPGYRLKGIPAVSPLTLGPLTLSATVKAESDGAIRVGYRLINPRARYTPQEILALVRDFQKLRGTGTLRVVFTNVAEEKIASGQLKEGIALLRQSATASSNSNPSLRLTSVYAQVGARAEAIKLCEKAIAKDPKNSSAYARLGWIYTHDEFGRQFRTGMNMAEAEKAYLKAIELNPGEKSYLVELATLYTYNSVGIRYGRSARLEDALQKFREIGIPNLAKYNALNQYALTLLVAGRYEDVKLFFLLPQAEVADPAVKLAAIAATTGATDVKEEADFIAPGQDKQKALLLEAAQLLLIAREYQPALALFQMLRVPVKGALGISLEKLRNARKFDPTAASPQPAIAAFQRFIFEVLNPANPDDWKQSVVPEARDQSSSQYSSELIGLVNGASAAESDISGRPVVSDVLTTTVNLVAEGSDAVGFRIRAGDGGAKSLKTFGYVVKRGNQYLVLGLAGAASSSGEALARVQAGDLAGARQWLDWAREELPSATSADPVTRSPFERLWPPKASATPDITLAAAAILATRGKDSQNGVAALKQLRERVTDSDFQLAIDLALAQDGEFSGAATLMQSLEKNGTASLESMRLREELLAQEGKLNDAATLEAQICANPKATAFDWNDLAWIGLFTESDAKAVRNAAEKAAQLTQTRNAGILQTLALVQASTGSLQQARLNAYRLLDQATDIDEVLTIFGRIAEELDLPNVAMDYYHRVKKPEGNLALSNYAFVQMRLKKMGRLRDSLPM